jgi:hypothetical protein
VTATRGDNFNGGRQFAVLELELAQFGFGVVNVDDENAGGLAGCNRNIAIRPLVPPPADYFRVRGGVQAAALRRWRFVARLARKHRHTFVSE